VADALAPGARLGSYEVVDRLGAGGMGEVYRARDTRLGRMVALKVLRSGANPELLRRLDREARAASALNHPNIVHIYDVGEAAPGGGAHYVVMELVEGETLRRRLRSGPRPMPELLDLGAQLADGLAKAHRAGIVHRDLKPENVMITPEGVAKILDFGLAKVLASPLGDVEAGQTVSRQGTQAGVLLGTIEYMSPEQASGRAVDHRTDQFSLGLILHEMATGRPAFRRDTAAQALAAAPARRPARARVARGALPAEGPGGPVREDR
jgi:serine/threonine protein kinase